MAPRSLLVLCISAALAAVLAAAVLWRNPKLRWPATLLAGGATLAALRWALFRGDPLTGVPFARLRAVAARPRRLRRGGVKAE